MRRCKGRERLGGGAVPFLCWCKEFHKFLNACVCSLNNLLWELLSGVDKRQVS